MIRAKFRCMGVTYRWDKTQRVEMLPVTHKESHTSGGEVDAEENLQFWNATPAGNIDLTFSAEQPCDFEPGAYYYIDFEESPEGRWVLDKVTQLSGSLEVSLGASWGGDFVQYGTIKMTIDNEVAWKHLDGKAGKKWAVTFTFAEASDS